jgi:predicted Zn-dependent protease
MRLFALTFLIGLVLLPTRAFSGTPLAEQSLIRDAEIEDVLKSYITPIFNAAKLDPKSLHLYVIYSKDVNAMAMGGGKIGVFTGLILRATSALQIIGVLAHETAHLVGHHTVKGGEAYEQALLQHLLGTLGGIVAGTVLKNPELGQAILMGSEDIAMRGLLKFSRTQEGSADQGATRFLDSLQWSSRGLLEFLEMLHKDDFLIARDLDPYLITHPPTPERSDFLRNHVSKSLYAKAPLPEPFEENFKRIKTKIGAFTESLPKTLSRFKPTDNSLFARYARAIAYSQASQETEALEELDSLLTDYPKDAFFWDLKGQILFESGKIQEAIAAYEKAISFRPEIPLLRLNLAHALLESGNEKFLEKIYTELLRVRMEEPDNPFTYHLLAIYYGKTGKTGLAALSLAEMSLEIGNLPQAEKQAKRALHLLKGDEVNRQHATRVLEEVEKLKEKESSWLGGFSPTSTLEPHSWWNIQSGKPHPDEGMCESCGRPERLLQIP